MGVPAFGDGGTTNCVYSVNLARTADVCCVGVCAIFRHSRLPIVANFVIERVFATTRQAHERRFADNGLAASTMRPTADTGIWTGFVTVHRSTCVALGLVTSAVVQWSSSGGTSRGRRRCCGCQDIKGLLNDNETAQAHPQHGPHLSDGGLGGCSVTFCDSDDRCKWKSSGSYPERGKKKAPARFFDSFTTRFFLLLELCLARFPDRARCGLFIWDFVKWCQGRWFP